MSELIKNSEYDSYIDKSNYFQSLIMIALENQIISDDFAEGIMLKLADIFAEYCRRLTKGTSSSIQKTLAEEAMNSIVYSLNHYFKSFNSFESSITILKSTPFKEIYENSLKMIESFKSKIEFFYELAEKTKVQSNNTFYTVNYLELKHQIKRMKDYNYFLQKDITFHYILSNNKDKANGIEELYSYLIDLNTENNLCSHFSKIDGKEVFYRFSNQNDSKINLLDHYIKFLFLRDYKNRIVDKVYTLNDSDLDSVIHLFYSEVCDNYKIEKEGLQLYLKASVRKLLTEILVYGLIL